MPDALTDENVDVRPHLVIAGASGLIGRRLVAAASERWRVTVLTRAVTGDEPSGARALAWNPRAARDGDVAHVAGLARVLDGADAVANFAGSSIADGRFDAEHRRRILDSRIDATTTLVEASLQAERAPRTFLQASGVGIYGDRGEEEITEATAPDDGFFMGEMGAVWEATAAPVGERSRLVVARIGIVLAPEAEAWRRLLLPIRLFVGGPLGSGRQWWPWIHVDDLIAAMLRLLAPAEAVPSRPTAGDAATGESHPSDAGPSDAAAADAGPGDQGASGPFNLVAPEPARQIEVTRAAARHLGRPSFVPVPAFALRLVLGGLPDMLLLPSARVRPERLQRIGFTFRHPTVREAVAALLDAERGG